jgi:glycosyltransferase involved in cell wall biosynthesis
MFKRGLVLSKKQSPLSSIIHSQNKLNPSSINSHLKQKNIIVKRNTVGVYSPYEYSIGGGESYISAIISFFIKNGAREVYFFNNTNSSLYNKTLEYYFTPQERRVIIKKTLDDLKYYKNAFTFFIHMSNRKESNINFRLGKKQIYHCQFPIDINSEWNSSATFRQNYDMVIVNSDFTLKYYKKCSTNHFNPNKIRILYPCCVNNVDVSVNTSVNNSININKSGEKIIFVTIGRIFENMKYNNNNNKYHDIIIRIFNRIQQGYSNYELHIIGSVKSEKWLKYLNNIKNNNSNIFIHTNLQNNKKNKILEKAKYIIHAAGIDKNEDKFPAMFEHFGISIIEGLMYNCIPICTNGGFPKIYIKDGENGYLFNTGNDLYNIINSILNKSTRLDVNKAITINKGIVERFSYKNYCARFNSILMSI